MSEDLTQPKGLDISNVLLHYVILIGVQEQFLLLLLL